MTNSNSTDKPATLSPRDARQGVMVGRMRYVVAISTVLAVVALALVYVFA